MTPGELALLGDDGDGKSASYMLTRLHTRYDRRTLAEDLLFREAPAWPQTGIQGRYIIRYSWDRRVDCPDPVYGIWASRRWGVNPPGQLQIATDLADAPRGRVRLGQVVRTPVPALGLKGQPPRQGAVDGPAPPLGVVNKPAFIVKKDKLSGEIPHLSVEYPPPPDRQHWADQTRTAHQEAAYGDGHAQHELAHGHGFSFSAKTTRATARHSAARTPGRTVLSRPNPDRQASREQRGRYLPFLVPLAASWRGQNAAVSLISASPTAPRSKEGEP